MIFYATMKNANITYQLDLPGEGPTLYVDATKMRQVFLHLVKNGIEAMPNGGTLKVSCREDEQTINISVSDTGSGISDSNLRMAADPFFTTKTYGTGMGLTLVQKITEMHDASFSLKHNEGGGMTAIVRLPKSRLSAT
jgi:signal transduction histidine kinase